MLAMLIVGAVNFASQSDMVAHHVKSTCRVHGSFVWYKPDLSEVTGLRKANCDDRVDNVTTVNATSESTSWSLEVTPNLNLNCREYWPAWNVSVLPGVAYVPSVGNTSDAATGETGGSQVTADGAAVQDGPQFSAVIVSSSWAGRKKTFAEANQTLAKPVSPGALTQGAPRLRIRL